MLQEYRQSDFAANAEAQTEKSGADHATAFLGRLSGGLPVSVAAIRPDVDGVTGATFHLPDQRAELREWIAERDGRVNLYYSLNAPATDRPLAGRGGKLTETDVDHIRGVAVDIDPGAGPLEEERARLLAEAKKAERNPFGAPSAIIDSGGGIQMLWLFDEPLRHTPETRAAVKAQARGLGRSLGSDAVHSVDHLFRLPFTRNLPNAKKRAKGRTEALAALLVENEDRYSLEALRLFAEPVAADEGTSAGGVDLDFAEVEVVIGAPEELPAVLRAAAQDCIENLDSIAGDAAGDRSATDYRIAAHLVREHGITDPTDLACAVFAAAPEKMLEKQARGYGESYARKTVTAALGRNRARLDPHDFFSVVTETDRDAADKLKAMFDAQEGSERPRIQVLKRSEIRRLRPPDFVIARHLPDASLGFLYGAPGSGKSFVAIDWAMHLASDRPDWHGDKIASKAEGWVVYLAREGATGMGARLEAWERTHTQFADADARFALIPSEIDFMKPGDIDATVEAVRAAGVHPVSMIVVDTVSRSMPGADENLQKDMTTFVAACDRLKDEFGCVVLGVHHASRKGEMRGSSVLLGAGDFVFRVSKDDSDAQSTSRRLNLFCEKMKEGADGWGADYWLDPVGLGRRDASGEEITSLVPRRAPKVERSENEAREATAWAAILLQALGDRESASWSELSKRVGEAARARGLIRAESEPKVRAAAVDHLGRIGADLSGPDGQIVNVSMQQAAPGKPWLVHRLDVDEPANGANEREPEGAK